MLKIIVLLSLAVFVSSATNKNCTGFGTYCPHLSKCYYFMAQASSWIDAENMCTSDFKGSLVSILSSYEQKFVQASNRLGLVDLWIGGTDLNHNGTWTWIEDQSNISYQHWAAGHPAKDDGTQCVYMSSDNGVWKEDSCTAKKYAICQGDPINPTNLSGWSYFDETKAYYMPVKTNYSWDRFEAICQEHGGHLASIHSKTESDIVMQVGLFRPECEKWAIGFRSPDFKRPLNFTWTDGTVVDYTDWRGSNPVDNWECTYIRFYDGGGWWNERCKTALLDVCGVCKKPK